MNPPTPEEARAFRRELSRFLIEATGNGHSKVAMAFGLVTGALDLCQVLCKEAGSPYPRGDASLILREIITVLDAKCRLS